MQITLKIVYEKKTKTILHFAFGTEALLESTAVGRKKVMTLDAVYQVITSRAKIGVGFIKVAN